VRLRRVAALKASVRRADQFPPGMQAALTALYGPRNPLRADELAAFDSARADEMARAEERRNPPTTPDLLDLSA
jgi:hypothetical protein